ncbi:hypothetical protein ACPB67_31895 [Micromonospora taraxaci]|uniref:hypothetical protein n=1 Tax=Micromonospora taraxaci TaxID=1316803 RepID=UPI003C2F58F1
MPNRRSGAGEHLSSESENADAVLAPLREALMDIRRHFESDKERLNNSVVRVSSSPLRREIRAAEAEVGPIGYWTEEAVLDELVVAGLTVEGASYHLYSIGRLLFIPVSCRSVQTLGRTCLEMAARAWWLLEPDIGVRERILRSVGEVLYGARAEVHALRDSGAAELLVRAEHKARDALEWAKYLGLAVRVDKKGFEILDGLVRPKATGLVNDLVASTGGKSRGVYGWLSAATHGAPFHLVDVVNGHPQPLRINPEWLALTVRPPVIAVREAHQRLACYVGSRSSARFEPYDRLLRELDRCAEVKLPVGVL